MGPRIKGLGSLREGEGHLAAAGARRRNRATSREGGGGENVPAAEHPLGVGGGATHARRKAAAGAAGGADPVAPDADPASPVEDLAPRRLDRERGGGGAARRRAASSSRRRRRGKSAGDLVLAVTTARPRARDSGARLGGIARGGGGRDSAEEQPDRHAAKADRPDGCWRRRWRSCPPWCSWQLVVASAGNSCGGHGGGVELAAWWRRMTAQRFAEAEAGVGGSGDGGRGCGRWRRRRMRVASEVAGRSAAAVAVAVTVSAVTGGMADSDG
ncbi:hypothetical protein [Oryza sativa Japonica Group]|uniref:Uncharacterized protein n=1 Tax=Oryza sativa subsp. japonica TaxID=39947 RepID=Q5JJS2_ORYSJ|nr:hypothetical protein [Oryza sativa Japonica Group]BAD88284.1 hypothetical protein [Oryza sativa Japonica Group]